MKIFQDLSPKQRYAKLSAHAWSIEMMEIEREATDEILDKLVDEALTLTAENEAMQKDMHLQPGERTGLLVKNSKRINEISQIIMTKKIKQFEDVYFFPDYAANKMLVFDINGHLVERQEMKSHHRQTNIFNSSMS